MTARPPERVSFSPRGLPDVTLEGELLDGGGRACVVSHPHPLAGGDMHHPVAAALWHAAADAGLRTLRYNFRGVGRSTGTLTSKSPLPLADLGGAIDFFNEKPVLAIGYSYGARVTLHALHAGEAIERAVLVGLPTRTPANRAAMSNLILGRRVNTEEFVPCPDTDLAATAPKPVLVIVGALDPLAEIDEYTSHGVTPIVIEGVNHFFSRRLGNQQPHAADLHALCRNALQFLLS